jgi:hypothetical protein
MQNTRFHVTIKPKTGRSLVMKKEEEKASPKPKRQVKEEAKIKTFKQFIL